MSSANRMQGAAPGKAGQGWQLHSLRGRAGDCEREVHASSAVYTHYSP